MAHTGSSKKAVTGLTRKSLKPMLPLRSDDRKGPMALIATHERLS